MILMPATACWLTGTFSPDSGTSGTAAPGLIGTTSVCSGADSSITVAYKNLPSSDHQTMQRPEQSRLDSPVSMFSATVPAGVVALAATENSVAQRPSGEMPPLSYTGPRSPMLMRLLPSLLIRANELVDSPRATKNTRSRPPNEGNTASRASSRGGAE